MNLKTILDWIRNLRTKNSEELYLSKARDLYELERMQAELMRNHNFKM